MLEILNVQIKKKAETPFPFFSLSPANVVIKKIYVNTDRIGMWDRYSCHTESNNCETDI